MKRPGVVFALLGLFLLATRLCHSAIVWVEEAYPAAAAIQLLHGKVIYRDFWFDKPPLAPLFYLLWGAHTGVALRIAGAGFVLSCCWVAWRLGREMWSEREGLVAAGLLGFFLTFDTPSAVMALAPDLLMVLPHLAAVLLIRRGQPVAGGVVAGLAMLLNPKAILVAGACLLWVRRDWVRFVSSFIILNLIGLVVLSAVGALPGYWQQVWAWGAVYSRDSFVRQPLQEGVVRTVAWAGFHLALVLPAAWHLLRDPSRRTVIWLTLCFLGVVLGWRFFPRYYFILLAPLTVTAARGFSMLPRRAAIPIGLLLIIPLVRFGPRYVTLAADLVRGRESRWADIAMSQDSAEVSRLLSQTARPDDTLLVWGYRPDIFMRTRMPAGTPFLDSQPLTGVIADRHLTQSEASVPELAAANRDKLVRTMHPDYIVDGLGLFNPALAVTEYPDLKRWLDGYAVSGRTRNSLIYRRIQH